MTMEYVTHPVESSRKGSVEYVGALLDIIRESLDHVWRYPALRVSNGTLPRDNVGLYAPDPMKFKLWVSANVSPAMSVNCFMESVSQHAPTIKSYSEANAYVPQEIKLSMESAPTVQSTHSMLMVCVSAIMGIPLSMENAKSSLAHPIRCMILFPNHASALVHWSS